MKKLNGLFVISAVYMALLGLGFVFAPMQIGINAVPVEASTALIAYLRVFGSTFIAIGVLNWMARNAEPSTARNAIIFGNIAGFGLAALLDVWGVLSGGRQLALVFAFIHLLFTVAFILAARMFLQVAPEKHP
jgi:hypothetical protein